MRSNVDLTEGRDFPDQDTGTRDVLFGTGSRSLPVWATTAFVKLVPWELHSVHSDDDFLYEPSFDPVFPTGSRSDIIHRVGVMTAVSDEHCDRCGKIIRRVPWDTRYGLCMECNVALEKEVGHLLERELPWERSPNTSAIGGLL
jgi:hypothetical protein